MRLLTRPADEPVTIETPAATDDDPREYVIGVSFPSGNGIAGLTHSSLMTRGEALFELEKWRRADSLRKHVLFRLTAAE